MNTSNGTVECQHELAEIRRKVNAAGVEMFGEQCLRCGCLKGCWVKKASAAKLNRPIPDWDDSILERWQEYVREVYAARAHERAVDVAGGDEEFRRRYEEYMHSPEWAKKRQKVLRRCEYVCEGCGDKPAVQVHHLTYKHFGDEFLWELRGVCLDCHERYHGKEIGHGLGQRTA